MSNGNPNMCQRSEILIVEDSRTQAEQLRFLLESNNYNVVHAINGKDALVILENLIPDLIISDINMPEIDGYDLCTQIKNDPRFKKIPVLLLTSLTDPENVLKGLACGADNFITKPYNTDYLISHIQQILSQNRLCENEQLRMVMEIFFAGKKRVITANQMQILSLLLSTYEAAVMQNKQLNQAQDELRNLNNCLEDMVENRTCELNESQEKYFDLYNNAPIMLLSIEAETEQIIECNDTLLGKTGFTRPDLIGKNMTALFHPDCTDLVKKSHNTFLQTGELINSEFDLTTKLGGRISVLINATAVKDEKGKIIHSRTVMQNISLLRRAKELIMESEERYRAVADSAVDSIITIDEDGIIVNWNQGAKRTFGYNEDEIIGTQVTNLMPDHYVESHLKGLKRIQQGAEWHVIGKTVELKAKRKNGEIFPIELSLAQWSTSTDKFFTGIIRDIKNRKIAERELVIAKEKAEESDKLKSAFLANMSHEIRTPLNGILGFSQLLKERYLSDKEKEEYINVVDLCSKQLLQTVNDIIDISKIEAGQDKAHLVEFNLLKLIEETGIFFQPLAARRNLILTIINDLPGNIVNVISDPIKLRQALNNIISNAIKFTEKGSVEINISFNNNKLVFSVKDTGIGIDPAYHNVIFDRFRQVEITNARKFGGTGLGLSLSKSFIGMLDGTLELDSTPGRGSIFKFSIPYLPAEASDKVKMNERLCQGMERKNNFAC